MTLSPIADLVRKHDPDRFLAALFAPADKRETLFLLAAFNHELARAREVASQPILALIRLQWWREVVEGARRRHEVAGPLGEAIDAGLIDPQDLLGMIEGREIEAEPVVPDRAAWLGYLAATAGGLAASWGRVLGADALQRARLRALGAAYGVAGLRRSLAVLARQERCLLPVDVLGAHGLTVDQVIAAPSAASPALEALAGEGLVLLRAGAGRFPAEMIAAALPAVLARRDLARPASPRPRGFGDKFAVTLAALRARV